MSRVQCEECPRTFRTMSAREMHRNAVHKHKGRKPQFNGAHDAGIVARHYGLTAAKPSFLRRLHTLVIWLALLTAVVGGTAFAWPWIQPFLEGRGWV